MKYIIGDIVVSGTDESPIISEIVEELDEHFRIRKPIYSLCGDPWKRLKASKDTLLERKADIKRKATPAEVDIFLDYYSE